MSTSRLSRLGVKITVPVIVIAVLAILLTVFLNHGKFVRTTTELESARIRFIVNDIKANLETGLGLGLSLRSLANAQDAIDFEARKDASILSIVVYDERGSVIFHAGNSPGATIPESWQQSAAEGRHENWQIADTNALVVGGNLTSAIGTTAGGVALQYSRKAHIDVVDSVTRALMLSSAAVIGLTVLIAMFGVNLIMRQADNKLKRMEDILDPAKLDAARPPPPLRHQRDFEAMALASDALLSSHFALRELSGGQTPSQAPPVARTGRGLYLTPTRRLFAFALLLLLFSQAVVSLYAWSVIEDKIRPELDRKAAAVGTAAASKIARAIDYGIPFDELAGSKEFFDDILKENDDLAFLVLSDADGWLVSASGVGEYDARRLARKGGDAMLASKVDLEAGKFFHTPVPIVSKGRTVGMLHVGVGSGFIASKISDLRYDIGIILMTSMLIAFEILLFIVTLNFSGPMRQIAQLMSRMACGDFSHRAVVSVKESLGSLAERLNQICARINQTFSERMRSVSESTPGSQDVAHPMAGVLERLKHRYVFAEGGAHNLTQQRTVSIRILTFLFMFAEMLSRPFLPLYVGMLPDPGWGLAPDFTASLPLTANLLGVACSMPFAGRWSDRLGRRRSYAMGAAIIILGLVCTAIAPEFLTLTAARVVTGVGYALMFMACQGYVVDHTDESNRSSGIASFVSAIMVAEICAPAVGGILADRIGYRLVFVIGAAIACIAVALAMRTLDNATARRETSQGAAGASALSLTANIRFMAIAILAGIPAKLLLSGFLIYLVPVIMTGLGSSKSEIGRYAMAYGVMALALTPLFASLTDRYRLHAWMVGAGGVLSGLGLLPILFYDHTGAILLGIAMLGLGQSMSISAQLVLVTQVTHREASASGTASVLGVFRLIERLGGAAGPAIAGALAAWYGPKQAMAALGVAGTISAVLFLVVFLGSGRGTVSGRKPDAPHELHNAMQEGAA